MKSQWQLALISFVLIWFGLVGLTMWQVAAGTPAALAADAGGGVPVNTAPTAETPVVARVYFSDVAALNRIANQVDVWEVNRQAGYLVAMLTRRQVTQLQRMGQRVVIDNQRSNEIRTPQLIAAGQSPAGIPGFQCYRTVEETYGDLSAIATNHSNLAEWKDIGDSWEKTTPGGNDGYDINALVLTNKALPGPKPRFLIMAAIHAREYSTAELATRFAEELVAKYGVDADVTWLLDYHELHIIPQANPDGRKIAEAGQLWRKNTNNTVDCFEPSLLGVDLNRNSSFRWNNGGSSDQACDPTYHGAGPASEPETQVVQNYIDSLFTDQRGEGDSDAAPPTTEGLFISLHSYSELVLFPWGWTPISSPNLPQLQTLGRKFGFFNRYQVCNAPACLYVASGVTDDYSYGKLGVASYTFELGKGIGPGGFFQPCSYFESDILPKNTPALTYAFKAARRPYQTPAGPEALSIAIQPTTVAAGALLTLSTLLDDTRYDSGGWGNEFTQAVAGAEVRLDAPSWLSASHVYTLNASDGAFDGGVENGQVVIDTTGWSLGRHTLFVEAMDSAGNRGVPSAVFVTVVSGEYAVEVTSPNALNGGLPGSTIEHLLNVVNRGGQTDTYNLQVISDWPVNAPATIGPLASFATTLIPVSVAVPVGTPLGLVGVTTVTVTSQANAAISMTTRLETMSREFQLFLPFVPRE